MPSIRKSLLQFVFSGAYMKRWNDKIRPMELTEVDKQAHKMIVAWFLLELNSTGMDRDEKRNLALEVLEGGIFDYFYRLIITDIKPPIFYRIKANPAHYQQLTDWVLEQVRSNLQPVGPAFWERFTRHVRSVDDETPGRRILGAAHLYASHWEFLLIKGLSPWDDELERIEASFQEGMDRFMDLKGMEGLRQGPGEPLGRIAHLCGQLRFQKRWSQTPRVPETSVLGHMFIVACYTYFFSLAVGACPQRLVNNFFAGLFHDLPELLTRDIISPVKQSVQRIGNLIKEYEDHEVEERVFGVLRAGGYDGLSDRLGYFLGMEVGSEFLSTVRIAGQTREVTWDQIQGKYNVDEADPKDGLLLKVCDSLAAFIEAYTALRNGISTTQLQEAILRIKSAYTSTTLGEGLHVGALLADFD